MRSHLRADAIRLGARWDVRGFLLLVPVLAAGGFLFSYATIESHFGWDPGQPMPPEVATAIMADRAGYAFPHSIISVLDNAPWVLFGIFFLAAGTTGLEFGWGTIRTALIGSPDRVRFVLSRVVAVGTIAAVALVALLAVGLAMPGVMRLAGTDLPPPPDTAAKVIVGAVAATVAMAPFFIALGVFLGVLTRGPAMPLLLLIVDFLAEGVVAGLPAVRGAGLEWLARSLPLMSVLNLGQAARDPASYGLPPVAGSPPPDVPLGLSFLVVIGWTCAFLALAAWQLRRTDVLE